MNANTIIEALKDEQKTKDEVSGLIDKLVESLSQEIAMLGDSKQDRLDRHAALGQRIAEECDAKADLLIRRKDLIMDIKAKLNGNHPEIIVLNPTDVVFLDGKPERQGLFRRRKTARAA